MVNRDAVRGQVLLEESREAVVVLDEAGVVLAAAAPARRSACAREELAPSCCKANGRSSSRTRSTAGRSASSTSPRPETWPRTRSSVRAFTAAVSHELRTPLARLSLLELASLPARTPALVEQARGEVDVIRELIDEVLFLAELESGRASSRSAPSRCCRCWRRSPPSWRRRPRAGVALRVEDRGATAEVRPRMMRAVARNLAENAIRYAGPGANAVLSVQRRDGKSSSRSPMTGPASTRPTFPVVFERFLPRRPLPRVARHGARPGDREARRRLRGWLGRGAGRSWTSS